MLEKRIVEDKNSPFFTTPESLTDFVLRAGKTVFREGLSIVECVRSSAREVLGMEDRGNNPSLREESGK